MLDQSQIEALLERPLTPTETTNFDSYLDIATKRLSNLLCFSLDKSTGVRIFDSWEGYRTLHVDPFTSVTAVKINDNTLTTWVKKQDDSYNGDWFNSIEFDDPLDGSRVEVTASWGFETLPVDLQPLLAGLFGLHESDVAKERVKSKQIEDFSVTYETSKGYNDLIDVHLGTIKKYAQCERAISHGLVRPVYYY